MANAGQSEGRSPWVYVGCACGCLVLLVLIVILVVGVAGFKTVEGLQATIEDPVKRAEVTQEILGYETMPEGYVAFLGIEVPFLFRLAMLANTALDEHGEIEGGSFERAFFYARPADWLKRDRDLRSIFEGQGDPLHAFEHWDQSDIRLRGAEQLGSGTVGVHGRDIRYAAARGTIRIDDAAFEGILAVIVVKCDERKRDGLGSWLLPDPDPDAPAGSVNLTGTPADPEALSSFLSQFDLCR